MFLIQNQTNGDYERTKLQEGDYIAYYRQSRTVQIQRNNDDIRFASPNLIEYDQGKVLVNSDNKCLLHLLDPDNEFLVIARLIANAAGFELGKGEHKEQTIFYQLAAPTK